MSGGLIRFEKYATQTGQLRSMGNTDHGDPVQTAVQTVACLVYQEEDKVTPTNPAATGTMSHFVILPTGSGVKTGDHVSDVVDKFGNTVLADARVLRVDDYNSWRYGSKFKRALLDVPLRS